MPQERCFQLVKNVLKTSARLPFFEAWPCFAADEWGGISDFIVPLAGTSYMFGAFILVLQLKGINSSQFVEMLKVKTTSLCFLCMPTKWSKTTTRRMPQCKAPCTVTTRRLYPHCKALVVILQAALYWWIAGRMACKRNPNIHSFLWYRWVWLGITPLVSLRNGTAKLVFATI